MSASPQQKRVPYDALSEPVSPGDASSAPLSQYLKAGVDAEDDGWTVFSSGETERLRQTSARLPYSKTSNVSSTTKRRRKMRFPLLPGGAYRVDYPFYDGEPAPQARESSTVECAYDEQLTLGKAAFVTKPFRNQKLPTKNPRNQKHVLKRDIRASVRNLTSRKASKRWGVASQRT